MQEKEKEGKKIKLWREGKLMKIVIMVSYQENVYDDKTLIS